MHVGENNMCRMVNMGRELKRHEKLRLMKKTKGADIAQGRT